MRVNLSSQTESNPAIARQTRRRGESNPEWIRRAAAGLDPLAPKVVLLGATDVAGFRVRVAQSHARRDLMPSFWSHVALYVPSGQGVLWHVPFDLAVSIGDVPRQNAIARSPLAYCEDAHQWQNIALLEFRGAAPASIKNAIARARDSRLRFDLVTPLVAWLGFVWGAAGYENPLLQNTAHPSAAFVDALFANSDIDLAPGMDDRTLCPEAIWQAAKWWSAYYADGDEEAVPRGRFTIGQGEAAVAEASAKRSRQPRRKAAGKKSRTSRSKGK